MNGTLECRITELRITELRITELRITELRIVEKGGWNPPFFRLRGSTVLGNDFAVYFNE